MTARRRFLRRDVLLLGGLAALLVVAAWVAGFASSLALPAPGPAVPADLSVPDNFGLYGEAWSYVDREFYGERPAPDRIVHGAVQGLVEALDDPYAAFLPVGEVAPGADPFLPTFVPTIGAWIEPVTSGAQVLSVVPGSPAAAAGMVAGDIVLAVGQEALAGLAPDVLASALDPTPEPTPATARDARLTFIARAPDASPRSLAVARARLAVSAAVILRADSGVPVLRLGQLDPQAGADVARQLDGPIKSASALVLDLRDNPGGDLTALGLLAGRFFHGQAWREVGPDGTEQPHEAARPDGATLPDAVRLIVLVNEGTAGTAEMLAGALRDRRQARLVGATSFGRGTIQSEWTLSDGSRLRLTTAEWRTPSGTPVEGVGLTPDDAVTGADAQLTAALRAAAEPLRGG